MRSTRPVPAALFALTVAILVGCDSGNPGPPRQRESRGPAPVATTAAEVHAVLMTRDPLRRASALGALLDRLGPESLAPVQEAYESVLLDAADWEVQLFVEWWARFDPPAATDWALSHYLGRHPSVVATGVRAWARRDPTAARAWCDQMSGGPYFRQPARAALVWGWDESGQPGVWDYIGQVTNLIDQQSVLAILVRRRLLRDGPEATFRWADQLRDDEPGDIRRLKLNTFRRIGAKLAEIDPVAASLWAQEVGEGEYGDGLYRRVAWSWVRLDAEAAMTWLGTLPPGPRQDDAVDAAFQRWISFDRAAALGWIEKQPAARWLDPALLWQATAVSNRDRVEGVRLARAIEREEIRDRAIFLILRAWRATDEAEADAWIAGQDLPAELIEKLHRFPGKKEMPARDRALERRRAREERSGAGADPAGEGAAGADL